ncbi:nucleotidyltransferase family protein [uncultured Tenacibaculum sp.]|uniref:nucleotidyltransferase family protein n=1 Tax=uncultured Tenacibaculum sp. TaxID=174713 RepID=UPI002635B351|nr:nucleotidyltransferase family protein [uncultured Tenacibaculum sp.]
MTNRLETEFVKIIQNDKWMIQVLKIVRDLKLNDSWIGAGFVRNKIWDKKQKKNRTLLNDIDVIYFDKINSEKEFDLQIEYRLNKINSSYNWSVKNQARMHLRNSHHEYLNCYEAISFWPETATAIAIRLNLKDQIEYIAPYGLEDLFNLVVQPTPQFDLTTYNTRILKKEWIKTWPKLKISNGN